jgi:hypothetical protein
MPAKKAKQEAIQIKLIPDPDMEINYPRLYANFAMVQSTPFDITIRFCDALPMFEKPEAPDQGIMEKKIPVVAEIVLPVKIFPNLIEAMKKQYDQYLVAYGEPKKDEKKK